MCCSQPDALFVVIPALALPTKLAATAYMATFVVGTMAAMGGYTAVIGAPRPWLDWCSRPCSACSLSPCWCEMA